MAATDIKVRIGLDRRQRLEQLAADDARTLSDYVRRIIDTHLEAQAST